MLTDIGHALLTDAIPIIKEMEFLESRSNTLSTGELASINLVIDRLFPKSRSAERDMPGRGDSNSVTLAYFAASSSANV